jgi:hypothetical protein
MRQIKIQIKRLLSFLNNRNNQLIARGSLVRRGRMKSKFLERYIGVGKIKNSI